MVFSHGEILIRNNLYMYWCSLQTLLKRYHFIWVLDSISLPIHKRHVQFGKLFWSFAFIAPDSCLLNNEYGINLLASQSKRKILQTLFTVFQYKFVCIEQIFCSKINKTWYINNRFKTIFCWFEKKDRIKWIDLTYC